jgi:hypothetical protein
VATVPLDRSDTTWASDAQAGPTDGRAHHEQSGSDTALRTSDLLIVSAAVLAIIAILSWLMTLTLDTGDLTFAGAVAATTCSSLSASGLVVLAIWLRKRR